MKPLTPWSVEAVDPSGQRFVVAHAAPRQLSGLPGHGVGGVIVLRPRARFLPARKVHVERIGARGTLRQRVPELAHLIECGTWPADQ